MFHTASARSRSVFFTRLTTLLPRYLLIFYLPFMLPAYGQINGCTYSEPGFPPADSLPCLVQGQSADVYIPYNCFDNLWVSFTEPLGGQEILGDRMFTLRIDSFTNLPCGLTLEVNQQLNPIVAGQTGCLHLQGTATDSAGHYDIGVHLSFKMLDVMITDYTHEGVKLDTLAPLSRRLALRVVRANESCEPVSEEEREYRESGCEQ